MENEIMKRLSIYYKVKCIYNVVEDAFKHEVLNKIIYAYKSFTDPEIQPISYEDVTGLYKKVGSIQENLCAMNLYGIEKKEYDEVLEEYRITQTVTGISFVEFINIQIKLLENSLKKISNNKNKENDNKSSVEKSNKKTDDLAFLRTVVKDPDGYLEDMELFVPDGFPWSDVILNDNRDKENYDEPSAIPENPFKNIIKGI